MAHWIRDYNCGCVPDQDYFCRDAQQRVEQEHDVDTEFAVVEDLSAKRAKILEKKAAAARFWLFRHYAEQEERGCFKNVDLGTACSSLERDNGEG